MTDRATGRVCMAKLARIAQRFAELDAERAQLSAENAKIFHEMADGEVVDMTSGKRQPRERKLEFDPVDPEARAKALKSLNEHTNKRRLRA